MEILLNFEDTKQSFRIKKIWKVYILHFQIRNNYIIGWFFFTTV